MSPFTFNRIFLAFVGFIVYGSLYPFNFTWVPREAYILDALYSIDVKRPLWGDLLSNVLLFIPFGFLGMAVATTVSDTFRRFSLISFSGIGLAFALQCAQVYLPTRYPSLIDALCNICGIYVGGLLFLPLRANTWPSLPHLSRIEFIAWGLIGSWFLDSLWPLVPELDFQSLKDGIKPLILQAPTSPLKGAMTAITWMIILHLWEYVQKKPPGLTQQVGGVAAMFSLEVVMEANALQWEEVLGAVLALVAWNSGISRFKGRKEVLIILLISLLLWKGLTPFIWRDLFVAFHWMPFGVSIMGEPMYQISILIQKAFLYGCLAWLLVERRTSLPWALWLSVGTLTGIELMQRYLVEHTPEITDPFLAFLLVLLIKNAFEREHVSRTQLCKPPTESPISTPHSITS